MYPAAKLCIAKAIKFLPKLQKCLALQAAEARAAGESPTSIMISISEVMTTEGVRRGRGVV